MGTILNAIKLMIIAILALVYYPLNMAFLFVQKHHRLWQKTDRVSYFISMPLYYMLFVVTALLSFPIETLGDAAHPNLPGFR